TGSAVPGSAGRLDDRQTPARRRRRQRSERAAERLEAGQRLGPNRVPDPGPLAFALDPSGFAQDPQVMRHGRLGDVVAGRDIAGADRPGQRELPEDRQADGIGRRLQELDFGICLAFHVDQYIDRCILRQVSIHCSAVRQRRPLMNTPIHDLVRDHYAGIALNIATDPSCSGNGDCCGTPNYSAEELASLPESAAVGSLGCGNPVAVADVHEGERVLDLGSGGGIDVLLSAKRVGPTGRAFGLDMTDEMLALAQRNTADAGATNVEFLKGHIESIPLPAESIDVVISNCVVNLAADKPAVFREIARVLRPGGRLGISDIVADDALTVNGRAERGSYVGCIAGALSFGEFESGMRAVGLVDVSVTPTH